MGVPDCNCTGLKTQRPSRGVNFVHFQYGGGIVHICQDREPMETWNNFAQ